jgi:hypothetical protein
MSNTKKTDRKNKTNLTVTWPSNDTYFGVSVVTQIGTVHGGKGRPKLAFAMSPVTEAAITSARSAGVVLVDKYNTVNVLDVKAETGTSEHETVTESKTNEVVA